jgi:hypothetical protein
MRVGGVGPLGSTAAAKTAEAASAAFNVRSLMSLVRRSNLVAASPPVLVDSEPNKAEVTHETNFHFHADRQ